MKQRFKDFLIEYYDVTKPNKGKDNKKSKKKKDKEEKCDDMKAHEELVDFLKKSTATGN